MADIPNPTQIPARRRAVKKRPAGLPKRPKKPITAYSVFLKEYFQVNKPASGLEARVMMGTASQDWKNLPAGDKQRYEDLTVDDRLRFTREMTQWRQQKSLLTRPASSYALFLKETWQRERNSGRNISTMATHVSDLWRQMADEDKNVYKRQYEASVEEFKKTLDKLGSGELDINNVGAAPAAAQIDDNDQAQAQNAVADDGAAGDADADADDDAAADDDADADEEMAEADN